MTTGESIMAARKVLAVLEAARTRIAFEGAWSRGVDARTAGGHPVPPHWPQAAAWSLKGALAREAFELGGGMIGAVNLLLAVTGRGQSLMRFNDRSKHEEILAKLDSAIALARRRLE